MAEQICRVLLVLLTMLLLSAVAVDICTDKYKDGNFRMRFPEKGVTNFATLGGFEQNQTALTVSFWMKTISNESIALVSYATVDNFDEIRIVYRYDKRFKVQIGSNNIPNIGPVTVNNGQWRHVGITWSNTDGAKSLYIDGFLAGTVVADIGHVIPANGSFVIGQDQDTFGGGFDQEQSFVGDLTNLNIWNFKFDQNTIAKVARYCGCGRGNLLAWPDLKGSTRGKVTIEATNCQIIGHGKDCLDLLERGHLTTGVYVIDPDDEGSFPVLCDQETNGGGWFVFQKRFNGSVDFHRNWEEYTQGFGPLHGEFWLGNDQLHRISSSTQSSLLVELEDVAGDRGYAQYRGFSVGSPDDLFELFLQGYSGTVISSFHKHSGRKFSTHDRDNDLINGNCAQMFKAGWWFIGCHKVNLNGPYYPDGVPPQNGHGIVWRSWKNNDFEDSLTRTTMKSRSIKELPWDYSLRFGSGQSSDNVSIPRITGWNTVTVAWWMKVQRTSAWRSVFSLENPQFPRAMAFHLESSQSSARIFINNEKIAINAPLPFVDDIWHHVCIRWKSDSGKWTLTIDGVVERAGNDVQNGTMVQEGRLVIGSGQDVEGFIGELSHFNVWDYYLLRTVFVEDMIVNCHTLVGNLVPWPQVKFWINGEVEVKKFVRCYKREAQRWALDEQDNNMLSDVYSSDKADISSDKADTDLKLLSVFGKVDISLPASAVPCVTTPNLCAHGLSIDFWLRYPALFAQSHILGGDQKYHNALDGWLAPLMVRNAKWLRCYRAADHGWMASDFHGKCDLKGPTVTLVKVRDSIFGGFLDQNFGGDTRYIHSEAAFLFSLQNELGIGPVKLKVRSSKVNTAARTQHNYGPWFGDNDLRIESNAHRIPSSRSNLGKVYELPTSSMAVESPQARRFLAGTFRFLVDDIEVFFYAVNHKAVGVQHINIQQLTASGTFKSESFSAKQSRWDKDGWCPFFKNDQWLQVALQTRTYIKWVRVWKGTNEDEHVKKFYISCHDGTSWAHRFEKTLTQNPNHKYEVKKSCKYIRIYPKEWKQAPCLKLQLLQSNNQDIDYDDSAVTASTERCMSPPRLARLGTAGPCYASWCGGTDYSNNQWLQVDMGRTLYVAYVATERASSNQLTWNYYLDYSLNGTNWNEYKEKNQRKVLVANWGNGGPVKNAILPPFYAQLVRFKPRQCHQRCCLRVEIYHLIEEEQFNILTSSGMDTNTTGMAFFHKYNILTNESSYHVRVATETRLWTLELSTFPPAWFHAVITWREDLGLRFYQDGRLLSATNKVHTVNLPPDSESVFIAASPTSFTGMPQSLQMSSLGIWTSFLSEEQITSILSGVHEDRLVLSNGEAGVQFEWQMLESGCDNRETALCNTSHGDQGARYIDASYPRVKGDTARLQSVHLIQTHNCIKFSYHMNGHNSGRLNVYTQSYDDKYTLIWRLAGRQGETWSRAEIPVTEHLPYKVIFEGLVGDGYDGDIGIKISSVDVGANCTFLPNEATRHLSGVSSSMISHIASYRDTLNTWLAQVGYARRYWSPCFRAIEHGWGDINRFHELCSNKGPSVVIVRKGSYIFGGFASTSWKNEHIGSTPAPASFLFSLKNALNESFHQTKWEVEDNLIYDAIRRRVGSLVFGNSDLCIALANGQVTFNPDRNYNLPSVTEPQLFFAGERQFTADDMEVLVPGDGTLCDPPCLLGQFCDEIIGKCLCEASRRDVGLCKLREDLQKKRDEFCSAHGPQNATYYARYDYDNKNKSVKEWRCFAEEALTEDRLRYDTQKSADAFYNHSFLAEMLDKTNYSILLLDKLTRESTFYWSMDNDKDLKNLRGLSWISIPNGKVSGVRGVRNRAIHVDGTEGVMTLEEWKQGTSCMFVPQNCINGFSLSMWLKFENKYPLSEQVFVSTGAKNQSGFKVFQPMGSPEQISFQVTTEDARCHVTFPATTGIWTYYVFSWSGKTFGSNMTVYVNGERIDNKSVTTRCSEDAFMTTSGGLINIGENKLLPLADFDEMLMWYKTFSDEEIRRIFQYYREGGSGLEFSIDFIISHEPWNSSLLDKETSNFKNLSRGIEKLVEMLSLPKKPSGIQVQEVWNATGYVGVKLLVMYKERGFEQVEPLQKNLSDHKMVKLLSINANNVYARPVKLHSTDFIEKTFVTITIEWIHPFELTHGIFQGYEFYCYEAHGNFWTNFTRKGTKLEHEIHNLTAFTAYNVSVRVLTLEGSGVWSPVISVWTAETAPTAPPSNVSGFNTSSRSLNASWNPPPFKLRRGVIRGYIVTYWVSGAENKTKQSETHGVALSVVLASLRMYTFYALQIAAFTLPSEVGPFSDVIYVRTSEGAPSAPPQNITARNTSSTSVMLEWSTVPLEHRHGIIRSYQVVYRKASSSNSLDAQTVEVSSLVFQAELKNLTSFVLYQYCVRAVTIDKGVCGSGTFFTDEGVPSVSPVITSAYNTSSTSIGMKWKAVSNDSVPGFVLGYVVRFKLGAVAEKLFYTSCKAPYEVNQAKLRKYTTYYVSIAAFTVKGTGPFSQSVPITTDEDIPESVPQNISSPQAKPNAFTLSWTPPSKRNGRILGYRIILFDSLRNKTYNIVVNSSVASIEGLKPYTEYKARIIAFTSKGESNASGFIPVKTQEAAPSKPPRNVTAKNSSSTGIQLNWKPVDGLFVNGKTRYYVIYYFKTLSRDKTVYNLSVSVEQRRRRRRAISADVPNFELQGLHAHTTYTIQLAAFTVDVGVRSPEMNVTTNEDVPSLPPSNITAHNTSSTSIGVQWHPVPRDDLNGILRGYKVFYKRANKPNREFNVTSSDDSTLNIELVNLDKFKVYDIRLLAVTIGDGNISTPVLQRTDQDVPDSAPLNVTAFPFNTTAIQMKWKHVPEEQQNGIILGYKVMLYDEAVNNIRNTTVQGSNTTWVIIGGLDIWTNYSSKVCAFTIKGNGPWGSLIQSRTAEEAPRFPPTNVTARNTSSTSLHVTWQPVNSSAITGKLRGYRVFYFPEDTIHLKVLKNVSVGRYTLKADIESLYKYTNYSIYTVAFTIADGVPSNKVYERTQEDRPDKPPSNVTFSYPSSTSFLVEWKEVPLGYRNGIIRSYSIHYEQLDGAHPAVTENVDATRFSLVIPGLKKFHYYNFTIWANTSVGSGPPSTPVLMTDQDVPNVPPPNIKAEDFVTTHTIPLQWDHIPPLDVNGILLGYRIRYKIINMGQYPYEDESPKVIQTAAQDSSVVLASLESFAVYRIEITGFTIKGEGPAGWILAETCRCVKRLTTNWLTFSPYVDINASGLLPPVFNDMTVECCRTCKSHGQSYVDFGKDGKDKSALKKDDNEFRAAISQDTDFHFPVYGYKMQDRYHQVYGYIGLIESPGIAYIVNTDPGETIAQSVMMEIFGTWPLLLMCLLFAYLAGLLLWITERSSDSSQFPKSFIGGAGEGIWWAYVTMTTVGYGDRTATTILGRIVGIAWTLVGLVINGILVSVLATALTSVSSPQSAYQLYGSKVAALHGSPEHHLAVRKNAYLDTSYKYKDYGEMYELLVNKDIEGALIDAYTVGSNKQLFEKPFLRIIKIYDYSATYGTVMGGDSRKLQKCFDDYVPMNTEKIFRHVASIVEQIEEPAEPLASERSSNLFDSKSKLFQTTLLMTSAMLCFGFLLGISYEFFYRSRLKRKVVAQDLEARKEGVEGLREVFERFQEQIHSVSTRLQEKHKHQWTQLLCRTGKQRKLWYMSFADNLPRSSRVTDSYQSEKVELEMAQRATETVLTETDNAVEAY